MKILWLSVICYVINNLTTSVLVALKLINLSNSTNRIFILINILSCLKKWLLISQLDSFTAQPLKWQLMPLVGRKCPMIYNWMILTGFCLKKKAVKFLCSALCAQDQLAQWKLWARRLVLCSKPLALWEACFFIPLKNTINMLT